MPSRRTVLKLAGVGCLAAFAGRAFAYPDVRLNGGAGTLHPAADRYLSERLLPEGESLGATLVAGTDEDRVGPDASDGVRRALSDPGWFQNDDATTYRLVVQYRSTPARPRGLALRDVEWEGAWTLAFEAALSEWSPLEDIDGEEGERLRSADELVYTSVWAVSAPVGALPKPSIDVAARPEE